MSVGYMRDYRYLLV